ncbi:type IV pilus secretin PilQ [Stutzerimonas sp. NM35]|uniref:type IV pilus secretin PilQ n=1 Tax=Stutzerimonas stutzeri TaxID=316 RepID=UPI0015E2707B|nr:type IV pilus secretin PilQ [Stutzerimonas stutzeri]MBA1262248.1 type IV pilus secretin PilQ [Stutzerimonas stutzeri]
MNTSLSRLGLSLLAAFISPALLAANLNTIDVASLPGDKVELKLGFDEPVAAPRGYTLDQPARIALDLPGVSNKLGARNRELGVGNARSVTVVEAQGRTRMIVNLTALMPYSTRVDGNNLFVLLGEGSAPAPVAAPAPASAQPVVGTAPVERVVAGKSISNIDFRRGEDGAGNVVITLSDPSISPNIEEQGGKIRVSFAKTQLPEALRVRLDVQDFATPVKFVDSTSGAAGATIAIEPTGRYDYLAYQTDDKLTISIKPLTETEAEQRKAEHFTYSGEKLSLNFQDIDVRSVLQLIADFTDLNLVASDTVSGNITLRLQNVPWDQALDLVLKTKGLDKRQVGNVLLVAPADEIAARERQELESQRQIAELAPLRREVVQVNYAKAADIARLFQSVTDRDGASEDRGSIAVDDRTNNIIAYQTQERLDELRRIVAQLDIPVRQVMIEARIVEANVDYDKSLGVRWGGNLWAGDKWNAWGKNGQLGVADDPDASGSPGDEGYVPSRQVGRFPGIRETPLNTPFVDMGAIGATSGIGLGFVTNNAILDLQLSAMEKTGNGEVVSQPKVVTADKETAKILKGSEVPYQEASSSGATSTSFKEAALSLEVTPQITPDNRIIMEVKVTKDEPDFSQAASTGGIPAIRKNEVNAKVLVTDGETIVIGGVFSNTQSKSVDKVPFLGDLPFVGRVFRRDLVQDRKSELLVFITPRIMNNQAIQASR